MAKLPGKAVSLWVDTTRPTNYPVLSRQISVDVAVIGGGIVGLTTAILLKQAGQKVAVVEAGRVGTGVTGHTTGKVSSLHQLRYQDIKRGFGQDGARHYGQANEAAIKQVAELVKRYNIDCDFTKTDNYTFTERPELVAKIKREAKLAAELGLPASFVTKTPLPWPVKGAVKFSGQAYFHATKYVQGLAAAVDGGGSYVFEETRAADVKEGEAKEGEACQIKTDHGIFTAKQAVIATNMPFLDRGLFFARVHPHRSYLIAAKIKGQLPDGMFITAEDPLVSILPYHGHDGDHLLIGGRGHKAGQGGDTADRYRELEKYARKRFKVVSITHRWSTEDGISVDSVPYVGTLTPFTKQIYVATGFNKWGLSNGTAAGIILKDLILERKNAWTKTFNANRLKLLAGGPKLITENVNAGLKFVLDRLRGSGINLEQLVEGEGKIARIHGEQVAVYRDDSGQVLAVSPVCTHLQCIVDFNNAEKTWDCPCHGSRFTVDGKVIQGPAAKPLEKKKM